MGTGPLVLLLHGAGASTHTWRSLAPLLAEHYTLVMPDLPGQGFSRSGNRMRLGLDAMAEDIAALLPIRAGSRKRSSATPQGPPSPCVWPRRCR